MSRARPTHQLAGEQASILPPGVLAVERGQLPTADVGDVVVLDPGGWPKRVIGVSGPFVLVAGDPLDECRRFIEKADWIKARSDTNPHEYVVEHRHLQPVEGGPLFDAMAAHILTHGDYRRWGNRGWIYRRITVDDFDYWITWVGDWECGRLINRKLTVEANWHPEVNPETGEIT